ncbi:MAG: hypothetical protein ACXAEX_14920 [Promethearchaeota archaeon]
MSEIDYDELHFIIAVIFMLMSFFFITVRDRTWVAMMFLALYFLGYNLTTSKRRRN